MSRQDLVGGWIYLEKVIYRYIMKKPLTVSVYVL